MYSLEDDCDFFPFTMEDSLEYINNRLMYGNNECIFVYDEEDSNSVEFISKFKKEYPENYTFIPSTEIKEIPINWITDELTEDEKDAAKDLIEDCTNLNDSLYSFHYVRGTTKELNISIHKILEEKGINPLNAYVYVLYGNNTSKMDDIYYKIMFWYLPYTINVMMMEDN